MKQKVIISQSRVLKTYNCHTGGVDQNDWLVGKYAIGAKGKKWYWALFTRDRSKSMAPLYIYIYIYIYILK
jgi:hypothetical protein